MMIKKISFKIKPTYNDNDFLPLMGRFYQYYMAIIYRKMWVWLCGCCFLLGLPTIASGETFATYLKAMLNNQPGLRAALYDVYSKGQLYDVSISQLFNPSVALVSSFGQTYSMNTGSSASFANYESTYNRNSHSLQLTQNIFNGGKDNLAMQQGRAVFHLSEWQYLAQEQELILQSAVAYTDVIKARKAYQLQKWNNDMMARILATARIRFRTGIITNSDLAQSESLKSSNDALLITAQNNFNAANDEFKRLFGTLPSKNLEAIDKDLKTIAAAINKRNKGSQKNWLRDFERRNPYLQQARLQNAIAKIQKDSNLVGSLPKIDFNLRAELATSSQPNAARNSKSFGGSITITQPLWFQGALLSGSRAVISAAKVSELQFRDTSQKLQTQFNRAYQDYRASLLAERAYVSAVRSSRLGLKAANIEYNAGKRTVLELMQAADSNLNNELSLLDASQKRTTAMLNLQMMTGDLIASNFGLASPYRALTERDRDYRGAANPFVVVSEWLFAPNVEKSIKRYPKDFEEKRRK